MIKTVPVIDEKTGETILYDLFVDDRWHGSRRTLHQSIVYFAWLSVADGEVDIFG
jgi:hypothetical protein